MKEEIKSIICHTVKIYTWNKKQISVSACMHLYKGFITGGRGTDNAVKYLTLVDSSLSKIPRKTPSWT